MSCFGESVYASLAQLSVQGQANQLLNTHKVGQLDVFSSAFFTHPSFAAGYIRCGEKKEFFNGGNVVFAPPRSFDVVHDVFILLELPGLIQTVGTGDDMKEVLPFGQSPRYIFEATVNAAGNAFETSSLSISSDFGGADVTSLKASDLPEDNLYLKDENSDLVVKRSSGTWTHESGRALLANEELNLTVTTYGSKAAHVYAKNEDIAQYVYAAGQYAIKECTLEIGGSAIDKVSSDWLFINEELHGKVGRRLQDMVLKVPNQMHTRSTIRNRLYVPLSFWFTGGDLSRALMTIALQLHRIDFRVTIRSLPELIANYDATITVYEADVLKGLGGTPGAPSTVQSTVKARTGEAVSLNTNDVFTGPVRPSGATANHASVVERNIGTDLHAYIGAEFHGCFLNATTRARYLKLQSQQLFFTVQEEEHSPTNGGEQNFKVPFKNAVFEIIAAVRNKTAGVFGETDPWKFGGTAADAHSGLHDDALRRLSFSLSSTPRTLRGLEAQFYRSVTQFQTADTLSDLKGLYYWPIMTREFLNGTRIVSSYINCSKVDDIRIQYQLNTEQYGGDKSMSSSDATVHFFARAWNLLSIKNSMAGKMFQ